MFAVTLSNPQQGGFMDNVITFKNGKQTTVSPQEALQNMENEGGITVTPPKEESNIYSNITQRVKKMFRSAT